MQEGLSRSMLNAELFKAVVERDPKKSLRTVQYWVSAGADVNAADRSGNPVLYKAVNAFAHYPVIEFLLKSGAKVDAVDTLESTALHALAFSGRSRGNVIRLLLAAGADLNATNSLGDTPLSVAAAVDSYEKVKLFLDKGANHSVHDSFGCTLLYQAILDRKVKSARHLLNTGANLNLANKLGTSPYASNLHIGKTPAAALQFSSNPDIQFMANNLCADYEGDNVGGRFAYSLASLCAGGMTDGLRAEGISKDEVEQRRIYLNADRENITREILYKIRLLFRPLLQPIVPGQELADEQQMAAEHIASALIVSTHCKREDMRDVRVTTDAIIEFLNKPEMAAAKDAVLAEIARSEREIGPSINDGVHGVVQDYLNFVMSKLIASPNFGRLKAEMRKSCYDVIGGKLPLSLLQSIPTDIVQKCLPTSSGYFSNLGQFPTPKQLIEIAIERADIIEPDNEAKIEGLSKYLKIFSSLGRLGATRQLTEALGVQDLIAAAQETVVARVAARRAARLRAARFCINYR